MARRTLLAFVAGACTLTAAAGMHLATQSIAVSASMTERAAPSTTATAGTTAAVPPPVDGPLIGDVVNVGAAKSERFYDPYLAAALNDIQVWWREQYPQLFGGPYPELEGGIFAAYPERTESIPGCGFVGDTTYQDVYDAGAFYCPDGDYMAYDDGEDGIIYELAEEFGASIVAMVMAHEWGHAIQARLGVLDGSVPTIYTEQQADCYSGAWARRAWNGQAPGIAFTDADIRLGMIALVYVRDPIGTSVFEAGGHGSAFDRIGAFQQGFFSGPQACTGLIDTPLPLLPNEFSEAFGDAATNGNAAFGYESNELMGFLNRDLTTFWPTALAGQGVATMPTLKITPVADAASNNCSQPEALAEEGAVFCPQTNEILFDEVRGRELYDDYGDFAVGYIIGHAWADGVQVALGSRLQGEAHALASDCLTGAWIASALPLTPQSQTDMVISPGDLDEAVQTALVLGDAGINDDVEGSAFERFAHLRLGVWNGLPSCLAQING